MAENTWQQEYGGAGGSSLESFWERQQRWEHEHGEAALHDRGEQEAGRSSPAVRRETWRTGMPRVGQEDGGWRDQVQGFDQESGWRGGARSWPRPGGASASDGPYAGRGPRNYQRPDERICEDVCDTLTRHGGIDASNVVVRVDAGMVTLDGSVETRAQKGMAEDAAWAISGVRDVQNNLRATTMQAMRGSESVTVTGQGSLKGND